MKTRSNGIKSVTERFCPRQGRNIVLEVSIGQNGERIENCLLRREEDCAAEGCVLRDRGSWSEEAER